MTGSVALDVVIGLVFIYLLYSLLTSLVAEIIATNLGLRARNLSSALDRMLNNDNVSTFSKTKDKSGIIRKIYDHPEIKSLTANRVFSRPSFIKPETFTRALVDVLRYGSTSEKAASIEEGIKSYHFEPSVEAYLLNLADEAEGDIDKLRSSFSTWFDNTMSNASEWYKRNLQIMLFFIGLAIAWFFNVNTFRITEKLSIDKDAREQLVQLAGDYIKNNPDKEYFNLIKFNSKDSTSIDKYNAKLDTLLSIKADLEKDIAETQQLLGGGTWLPDQLVFVNDKPVAANIQTEHLPEVKVISEGSKKIASYRYWDKVYYALHMLFFNFLGYATTAVALSLGAPFWFDILNKLMKLKSAVSDKK